MFYSNRLALSAFLTANDHEAERFRRGGVVLEIPTISAEFNGRKYVMAIVDGAQIVSPDLKTAAQAIVGGVLNVLDRDTTIQFYSTYTKLELLKIPTRIFSDLRAKVSQFSDAVLGVNMVSAINAAGLSDDQKFALTLYIGNRFTDIAKSCGLVGDDGAPLDNIDVSNLDYLSKTYANDAVGNAVVKVLKQVFVDTGFLSNPIQVAGNLQALVANGSVPDGVTLPTGGLTEAQASEFGNTVTQHNTVLVGLRGFIYTQYISAAEAGAVRSSDAPEELRQVITQTLDGSVNAINERLKNVSEKRRALFPAASDVIFEGGANAVIGSFEILMMVDQKLASENAAYQKKLADASTSDAPAESAPVEDAGGDKAP